MSDLLFSNAWAKYQNHEIDAAGFFSETIMKHGCTLPDFTEWASRKILEQAGSKSHHFSLAKLNKLIRAYSATSDTISTYSAGFISVKEIMKVYRRVKKNVNDPQKAPGEGEGQASALTTPAAKRIKRGPQEQGVAQASEGMQTGGKRKAQATEEASLAKKEKQERREPFAYAALPTEVKGIISTMLSPAERNVVGDLSRREHQLSARMQMQNPEQASLMLERLCNPEVPDALFERYVRAVPEQWDIHIRVDDDIPTSRLKKLAERFPHLKLAVRLDQAAAMKKIQNSCPAALHMVDARSSVGRPEQLTPEEIAKRVKNLNTLMAKCPNVKELNLAEEPESLFERLKYPKTLEKLTGCTGAGGLKKVIASCPALRELAFWLYQPLAEFNSLSFPATLQRLAVSCMSRLTTDNVRHILTSTPQLRALTLGRAHITGNVFSDPADSSKEIEYSQNLRSLELSQVNVDATFIKLLPLKFPHLEALVLVSPGQERVELNEEDMGHLTQLAEIKSFQIDGHNVSGEHLQRFFDAHPQLHTLALVHDEIDFDPALEKGVIPPLNFPSSLQQVSYLPDNVNVGANLDIVKKILNDCPNLKELTTSISGELLDEFKKTYPHVTFIRSLWW